MQFGVCLVQCCLSRFLWPLSTEGESPHILKRLHDICVYLENREHSHSIACEQLKSVLKVLLSGCFFFF